MSSHHTQDAINLHHSQVDNAKSKRQERQAARQEQYLTMKQDKRKQYDIVLCFGFIWFAYMNIATAVYLGYVI